MAFCYGVFSVIFEIGVVAPTVGALSYHLSIQHSRSGRMPIPPPPTQHTPTRKGARIGDWSGFIMTWMTLQAIARQKPFGPPHLARIMPQLLKEHLLFHPFLVN